MQIPVSRRIHSRRLGGLAINWQSLRRRRDSLTAGYTFGLCPTSWQVRIRTWPVCQSGGSMRAGADAWNTPPQVAGGLLLLLSLVKALSALQGWAALAQRADPVLGLPANWTMLAVGLIELAAAGLLLRPGLAPDAKAWLMSSLALGWMLYQAIFAHLAPGATCPCLGRTTMWFPVLAGFEQQILTSLTLWFFLVGMALITLRHLCKPPGEIS